MRDAHWFDTLFEDPRKRVTYREAMQEYGRWATVKGTYDAADKTIEVDVGPLIGKLMELIPDDYIREYQSYPGCEKETRANIANDFAKDIIHARDEDINMSAPEWGVKAVMYVRAAQAMGSVYGTNGGAVNGASKVDIDRVWSRIENLSNPDVREQQAKFLAEREAKLEEKLKELGF